MSTGRIPLAGVIGAPVGHSLSPKLHGYWLRKYGIEGYYVPIELTRDTFDAGVKSLPQLGFRGVNVTIPFKELALALADDVTDRAALIGAANTLTFRKDGRIHADNTDGYGFIANIRQFQADWNPTSGPAMVLGAGGAARAVASALLAEGVPELILANRTTARAENLQEKLGARARVIGWNAVAKHLGDVAMLANTTALGMNGQPALSIDLAAIKAGSLVTDIVYAPLETPLLQSARDAGCKTVDGLGMLLHQAAPGFEAWFRKKPTVEQALRDWVLEP